ncbi:hypothetical protein DL96DRAFT_1590125 [Flagelloscypha sp. PMI_526]|nr:hypothetical protein DL96DRAFT_1590125 [Flagelloscypha sp. PMI_526]
MIPLAGLLVLTTVFTCATLAQYCPSNDGGAIAIFDEKPQFLGWVSSKLNSASSFGITNDSNSNDILKFQTWYNCKSSDQPFPEVMNPVNNTTLPGWLTFAPSDGNPKGRTPPRKTVTTVRGGWNSPWTLCGENMIWAKGTITATWEPNWINPTGLIFPNPALMYDMVANMIVFAYPTSAYPHWARTVPITLFVL